MEKELADSITNSGEKEKKIICPTYDGLVRTLAEAMEVDKVKIVSEPEKGFNHEDILSWIGMVDFKDRKKPSVIANLSSDQGKRVIRVDVQSQKEVEGTGDKATDEELIYSMALVEAKMKVVSETAEEVYPAIVFQINDLRKNIKERREVILKNITENKTLSAFRRIDRLFLVSLALIATMSLHKSQPIVGRDAVSPVIAAYGEAVIQDFKNEWGGLTQEEIDAREACLAGFSCTAWEQLGPKK